MKDQVLDVLCSTLRIVRLGQISFCSVKALNLELDHCDFSLHYLCPVHLAYNIYFLLL